MIGLCNSNCQNGRGEIYCDFFQNTAKISKKPKRSKSICSRMFQKKTGLKFHKIHSKETVMKSFLVKLQPEMLLKKNWITVIFLWLLQNFKNSFMIPIVANLNLNLHRNQFKLWHYIEISNWNQEQNRFLILFLLRKFY